MEIGKTFSGRADGCTDGRTHLSSNLLGHRRGDDLVAKNWQRSRVYGSGDILTDRLTDRQTDVLITLLATAPAGE